MDGANNSTPCIRSHTFALDDTCSTLHLQGTMAKTGAVHPPPFLGSDLIRPLFHEPGMLVLCVHDCEGELSCIAD